MMVYTIVPVPDQDSPIWSEVVQSPATARRSLDGTLCILKWSDACPPEGLPEGAPLYYHPADPPEDTRGYVGDILTVMDSPEWTAAPG